MNYTEVEAKVREATNDEAWGPHGSLMNEIAQYTFQYDNYSEAMSMLWKRLLPEQKNWRSTYKSLLLLNYLIKNGSEKVVTSAREHLYDLRSLENYTFVDENGKDQGINSKCLKNFILKVYKLTINYLLVRHKVKEMLEYIQDDDKVREERKKAKKNKEKFVGVSSDFHGSSSSYSSRSYNDSYSSDTYGGNRFKDLEDRDWRGNNPSLQDRISDITNKVKTIIEGARDTEDHVDNNELGEDDFREPRPKFGDFSSYSDRNKNNTNDMKQIKQVPKLSNTNVTINKIQLKQPTTITKSEQKVPRPPTPQQNQPEVDLFTVDDDIKPKTDQSDFGDFVSHDKSENFANFDDFNKKVANVESQSTAKTDAQQTSSNLDLLLSLDIPIQPTISTVTAVPTNTDLLSGLGAPVNPTPNMPISFTMPNLYQYQTPVQPQINNINSLMQINQLSQITNDTNKTHNSNTSTNQNKDNLWTKLGGSVDINLDNLLPHSKGQKTTQQNNIPLNAMVANKPQQVRPTQFNQQQPIQFMAQPQIQAPLSPSSNINLFPNRK